MYYKNAIQSINDQKFDDGNSWLRKMFALKTILPDEAAYYYGVTLVERQKYVKGKEALQKYLSLASDTGRFVNDAKSLINKAEGFICKKCNNTGFQEVGDSCMYCGGEGKLLEDCNVCNKKGIEVCATCSGRGIRVVDTGLGKSYHDCNKCNGKGIVECHACKGLKKKEVFCDDCGGIGIFKKKIPCNH